MDRASCGSSKPAPAPSIAPAPRGELNALPGAEADEYDEACRCCGCSCCDVEEEEEGGEANDDDAGADVGEES